MSLTPKTIQIFLPGGDPRGIRVAEVTTRIVQVLEVPRSLLGEFLKMPESGQVAVYFLFGESEDGAESKVYVGQTSDLRARLGNHNKEKGFWERALVLISRTQSLTQTHAQFLEWHCLQEVRKAARYADANGNCPGKPHTLAPLHAECVEIFETGRDLLATLGYPLFDAVAKPVAGTKGDEMFYCKGPGADGRGIYSAEGFVVLKASVARLKCVPHYIGTGGYLRRQKLIEAGVMKKKGKSLIFEKDHLFSSASMAAQSLLGRTANGWTEWKTKGGKTLDAVKRQGAGEE
ncbi:MAG: GIY-YIG nuclease family protein [Verrucomicrobia bacterium]|nr:GIY-YIG nuclease family protein [Verrucomicrobiota bacterium]